jgi:peptidoglycan/LPS O-acetylase OafA/YrhL
VIAAASVVLYHVLGARYGANPTAGVIFPSAAFLFFVISGFVIYRPFAAAHLTGAQAPSLARFYRSRLVRVLPLWCVAVTVYLVVDHGHHLHGPGQWIATYLLVQYPWHSIRYSVIGPAWALSVEWIFYLIAPLLALAVRSGRRRLSPSTRPWQAEVGVLGVLFVVAWIIGSARPAVALVVGMGLGVFDVHRRQTRDPRWLRVAAGNGWILIATTVASWVALAQYPYQSGLSVQWVERDAAVLAIWIATATLWFVPVAFGDPAREPQRTLGGRRFVALSQLTFGLYIWHQLVLDRVIARLGRDGGFTAILYLTAGGAIALSLATYLVIERPGVRLNRRAPWSGAQDRPVSTDDLERTEGDVALAATTGSGDTAEAPAAASVGSEP